MSIAHIITDGFGNGAGVVGSISSYILGGFDILGADVLPNWIGPLSSPIVVTYKQPMTPVNFIPLFDQSGTLALSAGVLPNGLTFTSGKIQGTPFASSLFRSLVVTLTNPQGHQVSSPPFDIRVDPDPMAPSKRGIDARDWDW